MPEKTKEGFYIPPQTQKKYEPTQGEVRFLGPGKVDEPINCKIGDKVVFNKMAGMDIAWNGEDLKIIRWSDILVVL